MNFVIELEITKLFFTKCFYVCGGVSTLATLVTPRDTEGRLPRCLSLYRFFEPVEQGKKNLPSPDGDLSFSVPSSSIDAANKKVDHEI